jgi:hypothetical protein
MHADLPKVIVGFEDVFGIAAILSSACAHMFKHRLAIETPGVLVVEPVGDISDGEDALAAFKGHGGYPLEVDRGHLFPFPKVADRRLPQRRIDLEGHPLTGPASIEAKHESWPLRRAAVNMGVNA